MTKTNAILQQTKKQLENLFDYIALHQDDFGPVEYDIMQVRVEIMQDHLTRIEHIWNECREVEK